MKIQKTMNKNNKESHCVTKSTQTHDDSHYYSSEEIGIPCDREISALNAG